MSVLIKDVKMPTCCEECAFVKTVGLDRWKCELSGVQFNAWDVGWGDGTVNKYIRHESCPLVEVPPHGRLIDADDFEKRIKMWTDHPNDYIRQRNQDMLYYVQQEDTVIEAEEGEE